MYSVFPSSFSYLYLECRWVLTGLHEMFAPACLEKKGASYGREPKQRLITRRYFNWRPTARSQIQIMGEGGRGPHVAVEVGPAPEPGEGVPSEQVWTGRRGVPSEQFRAGPCSGGGWARHNGIMDSGHMGITPDGQTQVKTSTSRKLRIGEGANPKVNCRPIMCHRNCKIVGPNSLILRLTKFNIELMRSWRTYIFTTLLTLENRWVSNKWRVFEGL